MFSNFPEWWVARGMRPCMSGMWRAASVYTCWWGTWPRCAVFSTTGSGSSAGRTIIQSGCGTRTRKAVFTYSTAILTGSTHYRYKDTWGRGENRLAPGQKVGLGLFLVDSFRLGWGSFRGWAWIGFGWSNMTCMSLASVCKTLQGKWCDTTQNNTTQHDTISHNTSPPALQGKSKNTCTWVK